MSEHLTTTQARSLHRGDMAQDEADALRRHLEECSECRRVVQALSGDSGAASWEDTLVTEDPASAGNGNAAASDPGSWLEIPGYEILSEISRGGQGVVFKAIQKATKRAVALKVLTSGAFASDKDRRRFEREVDLAASLDHPAIVTVYDSGEVQGQPYCAMQYVRGEAIDAYVESHSLDLEGKLQLFRRVCDGVSYAHQRGIIHRDLKPANILISGSGRPHILDFGLARASGPTGALGPTVTGEFLGTLAYASPEQVAGDAQDLDIRTDIYSLGVILYRLLTGRHPYPVEGEILSVLKNISQASPRPPRAVLPGLPDEVETIVLKALAKERERRYQSAEALGRDIHAFLNDEPIEARKDSRLYLLRKTVSRFRVAVAVVAGILLLLAVGGVALAVLSSRLAEQRDRARSAELSAIQEAASAVRARRTAEDQRRLADQRAYLASIAAAEASLRTGAPEEAREHLEGASPAYRGWEWEFLLHRLDSSHETVPLGVSREHPSASPQGLYLGAVDRGRLLVWETLTGRRLVDRPAPGARRLMALLEDPWRAALLMEDEEIAVWDLGSREVQARWRPERNPRTRGAFSRDGEWMVYGVHGPGGLLEIRATGSGRLRSRVELGAGPGGLAFLSGGERLISVTWDGVLRVFDTDTGGEISRLPGHDSQVFEILADPSEKLLYSGGLDGTVRVWDLDTGSSRAVLQGHSSWIVALALSPRGGMLASASIDGSVRLWTGPDHAPGALLYGGCRPQGPLAFDASGRWLRLYCSEGDLRGWDLAGELDVRTLTFESRPEKVAFSPDGTTVATGATDGHVRIYDAGSGELRRVIEAHVTPMVRIRVLDFDATGERIATWAKESTGIRLWDPGTGEALGRLEAEGWGIVSGDLHPRQARAVTLAAVVQAGGEGLAEDWEGRPHRIHLWDLATLAPTAHVDVDALPTSVSWLGGGEALGVSYKDGTAEVRDPESGALRVALEAVDGTVQRLVLGGEGPWLVGGLLDGRLAYWDPNDGRLLRVLQGHGQGITGLEFHPGGGRLVSSSNDGFVRLWSPEFDRALMRIRDDCGWVRDVAFSPDGRRLASVCWDHTLVIRSVPPD